MNITICKIIYKGNTNQKKAKIISDEADMEMETIIRNKGHFIIIKGTTCSVEIKILDLYGTMNNIFSNYAKQI